MPLVHDLLALPDAVRKGDFVQDLTGGIADPERTLRDYAITPAIVQTFRHALSIVSSALRDGRSQAAYLHGSFGAGKSHFMAVLDLMLSDHAAPWRRTELHPLRAEHDWIGRKRVLQLPIHMLGATDMESKLLGSYVRWVAEHHPDAPVPAVYADQGLFDVAKTWRADLGDDAFFARLNGGLQAATRGWGALGAARRWEPATFDAAVAATYAGERDRDANSPRARLFSDLVRTYFPSWTAQPNRFVDLDAGLGIVSRHAQALGYDAIVLYLDELVLWLAGNASDLPFVGREVQKMVKLKEAQDADRAIPIVSFIARQRDLSQFLGEQAQGAVRSELSRNLSHHEGRFETVTLADSNLPAIVAHRVVRPKDEAARQALLDDFARTWRLAGQAAGVLVGSEGDEADFRRVYPFSPALVEALVALSDCLQRERTAIRILMELLVNHLPDLETGRVVPVGDAFDALAESEDPIDDAVMKARFERARDLYQTGFLPLIRAQHNTESPAACQRLRDDHDRRLGCSRCPQRACRNDNRLAKTLLMAALVPEAKPFKGLTVKRLVHLNHGTIASPIPGAEMQVAAQRLRDWATKLGSLRLGDQADPDVGVHLAGVDLGPILAQAAEADTPGARKSAMKRLLFLELGVQGDGAFVDAELPFHGTRRKGRVRYGNVREMEDAALTCPRELEWQLVVDYPFDERGHGPEEDARHVERFRDTRPPDARANPTLVWLPTFFSHAGERELGELVVLEHILDGDARRYLGHLRVEDQVTTRADLTSLRAQKEANLKRILAQAYGLTTQTDTPLLDRSRPVDEHLLPLLEGLELRMVLAGTLKDGLRQVVDALLSKRYPHHPRFDGPVHASRLERVRDLVGRLLDERDRRMSVERADRGELRAYADPLGITETGDLTVALREAPFTALEQRRVQSGLDTPTAGAVRAWLDPNGTRGLLPEVQDVLIVLFAAWSGRTLRRGGRPVAPGRPGQLPDDVELLRPELPTPAEWAEAIRRAGELFGVSSSQALNARNLATFCEQVKAKVGERSDAPALATLLEQRTAEWADPADAPRLRTGRAAGRLVQALAGADGADLVRLLAAHPVDTSLAAMSRSLSSATAARRLLAEEARWIVFRQVKALVGDPTRGNRAEILLGDLRALLGADELVKMLSEGLAELTRRADELLRVDPPPPPAGWREVLHTTNRVTDLDAVAGELEALAGRIRRAAAGADEVKVEITTRVSVREPVR